MTQHPMKSLDTYDCDVIKRWGLSLCCALNLLLDILKVSDVKKYMCIGFRMQYLKWPLQKCCYAILEVWSPVMTNAPWTLPRNFGGRGPTDSKTLHCCFWLGHTSSMLFLDTDAVTQPKMQTQNHTTMVSHSVHKPVMFCMF